MKVFIHTYKINDWERILQEQMDSIIDSGLSQSADIQVCDGDGEDKTLLDIWNYSQSNDGYILYLHNLGITWQETKYEMITEKYRRWVMTGVVDDWENYVLNLEKHDVVGDNYKPDTRLRSGLYKKHFATNNWWTKTDYVKTLQEPNNLRHQKEWETWICSGDGSFKELRQNFVDEPIQAYNNPQLKNIPK